MNVVSQAPLLLWSARVHTDALNSQICSVSTNYLCSLCYLHWQVGAKVRDQNLVIGNRSTKRSMGFAASNHWRRKAYYTLMYKLWPKLPSEFSTAQMNASLCGSSSVPCQITASQYKYSDPKMVKPRATRLIILRAF
jgi:hypothetical protein